MASLAGDYLAYDYLTTLPTFTKTATVTSTDVRAGTITIYASHGIYFLGGVF